MGPRKNELGKSKSLVFTVSDAASRQPSPRTVGRMTMKLTQVLDLFLVRVLVRSHRLLIPLLPSARFAVLTRSAALIRSLPRERDLCP